MDFRRAIPTDSGGIASIESKVFPDAWNQRDITNLICTEGGVCFVAMEGDKVVAYVLARLIPPECEIYRVAVLPEYRKRGIAYRLMDYAIKTSRGKGLEIVFLEVRESNLPAVKLYEAYGFKRIGLRKNYYKNPTENAVLMLYGNSADLGEV